MQLLSQGKALTQFLDEKGDCIRGKHVIFHRGVTWSDLTSGRFSARLSPGGFIFDVKGSSAFPQKVELVLALLNSQFAHFALNLLNPTVSFQVGDLARLPIPSHPSETIEQLVEQAVALAKAGSAEDESTWDFAQPPLPKGGIANVQDRRSKLAAIESEINEETFKLYGISDVDRRAVERETSANEQSDEESKGNGKIEADWILGPDELARRWLSYALGIVMGRFQPGVEYALGKGDFTSDVAVRLREVADPDGVLVHDSGHTDDVATRLLQALTLMLGEEEGYEIVRTAAGDRGSVEDALRGYLDGPFWKHHIKQYRKRPIYWFFQSPKKKYGVWVFHERMTEDTLFRMQREYVDPKINLLHGQINDLKAKTAAAEGRERRKIEKEIEKVEDVLDDVHEFAKLLDEAIKRGSRRHIDDGALLNMAPLWKLFPSWQAEPKKVWQSLERGDYDWSHQAMDHWPDRVREKCETNKSYAIAHGLA